MFFSLVLMQCTSKPEKQASVAEPTAMQDGYKAKGLAYAAGNQQKVEAIYSNLVSALEDNNAISIVAQVNHQQNASKAGMDLNPTRVVLFGNPKLGTPLMQANQQAGLDLPQKILVYEDEAGETYAAFNSVQYLASRHGLDTVSTLPKIENALSGLVKNATNSQVVNPDANSVSLNEGVVSKESTNSFTDTYEKLSKAIEGNANIKIMAELDHQQNAKSVGLELNPTKLIVFGNPNLGTPLMQAAQTVGIDLPQKMLVYQDNSGTVRVAYNDPYYLAERHGIDGQDDVLRKIADALGSLATAATK
ncbi:DUF302 domain-containing protein [Pontibacter locisalis]|uniref:DUF302 domain-containing protein n=1 Tax=Pontibacter locisalis TaxID=1719035 RepID=UPI003672AE42